jgi:hypothetical protein
VAQLVHEEQQDEERREGPAPEQRVGADGDDHRQRRRDEPELRRGEEQEFQLEDPLEAENERSRDRPEDAARPHAQGALRVDRPFVEARLLRRQRREERFALGDVRAHDFKVARRRLPPS